MICLPPNQDDLVAAVGVDGSGGQQDLHARPGLLVAHVFQVVHRLALGVGRLDVPEELRDVGVVPEADEGLGIVAGGDHVVAFVLPSQLVVMLLVPGASGVALDGHVARGMVGVVIIESDGEVAAELLDDLRAQHRVPFFHEEGGEGEFHHGAAHFHEDGHFHRDQVEHPGAVAHLLGEVAELHDISAAPDPFQVHRLATERIGSQAFHHLRKGRIGKEFHVLRLVGLDVEVHAAAREQLPAQVHGDLEVAVIAAADDERRRERGFHAQVDILSPADAEDGFLGRDIQVSLDVVQAAEFRDEAAGARDDGDGVGTGHGLPQRLHLVRIQQPLVAALVQAAEQQGGILAAVPAQVLVHGLPQVLLAPVALPEVDEAGFQAPHVELLLQEVRCAGEIGGDIAVQGDDGGFLQGGGRRCDAREHLHAALHQGFHRTLFEPGPVHRLRVVVREGVIHE